MLRDSDFSHDALVFPDPTAIALFVALTALTICAGHSVGMHRLLIHRSFETYRRVEYLLVWLVCLVGMAGPFGMIKTHDMRDWHQRQSTCPPHPAHRASILKDAWWQLCCEFKLSNPPDIILEDRIKTDRLYAAMERTWMLQQAPIALLLFLAGGWAFVLWGVSLRIFISLTGHWLIGHLAHTRGAQPNVPTDMSVQGYNLPGLGLIAFGENWHGNHHAFPTSANLGVSQGQSDPGFRLIQALENLGLAWNIQTPAAAPVPT